MQEKIELKCKDGLTDGFELAIKQLGYKVIDSSWDDEKNEMSYIVASNNTLRTQKK